MQPVELSTPENASDSENSNSSLDIISPPDQSEHSDYPSSELTPPLSVKCKWRDCGLKFSHLDALAAHVTSLHANPGPAGLFFCGWDGCNRGNRGFNARYKMLVHVRTHTNEKPHHCYQCDKSFSRAENLKIHARSHTGERPYLCPVPGCAKAYSNSSDRFKHTRTHFVDKPYVCKIAGCGKRYTDPSSLRKHVKTYRHAPASDEHASSKETIFKMEEDIDHEQIVPELQCEMDQSQSRPLPSPAEEVVNDVRYEMFRNWFSYDNQWEWLHRPVPVPPPAPANDCCRYLVYSDQDTPLDLSVRK